MNEARVEFISQVEQKRKLLKTAERKLVRPIHISDSFNSLYRFEGSRKRDLDICEVMERRREAVVWPNRRGRNGGSEWKRAQPDEGGREASD